MDRTNIVDPNSCFFKMYNLPVRIFFSKNKVLKSCFICFFIFLKVQGFDHRAAVKSPEQSPVWNAREFKKHT